MTWDAVARKDFHDAARSRWLWGLSLFFVAFIGGTTAAFFGYLVQGGQAEARSLYGLFAGGALSFSYTGFLGFALAFIALVSSYGAVIDERESGSLKLLLSLPHSRSDVVFGKLAGRSAVVVLPVLVGFVVALVALFATGTGVDFGSFFPHVALTALLGAAFVALGVGVSAASASSRRAILVSLGVYFLFALLWSLVAQGVPSLVRWVAERLPGVSAPGGLTLAKLQLFVTYLNPLRAYETLVAQLYFGNVASARLVKAGLRQRLQLQPVLQESIPFYFTGWFILLVLLAWIAVPPVLGYLVFEDADL